MCEMPDAGKGHAQRVVALEVGFRGRANLDGRAIDLKFARGALDGAFLIAGAKQVGWQDRSRAAIPRRRSVREPNRRAKCSGKSGRSAAR